MGRIAADKVKARHSPLDPALRPSNAMSYLCRRMAQALQVSSGFVALSAASKAALSNVAVHYQ
jgi:hypothetical protein